MVASKKPEPVDGSVEDTRRRLVALRDKLEKAIEVASENMLPQLAGRYQAVVEKLAELPAAEAGPLSKRDELKERRERKHDPADRGATSAPPRAARAKGGQRRP